MAQHVIVHARQIIVNQGVGMDAFDSQSREVQVFGLGIKHLSDGINEQRTHALTASDHGVAHG